MVVILLVLGLGLRWRRKVLLGRGRTLGRRRGVVLLLLRRRRRRELRLAVWWQVSWRGAAELRRSCWYLAAGLSLKSVQDTTPALGWAYAESTVPGGWLLADIPTCCKTT